ncbi:MAG: hypothetical protein AAFR90_13350 [Pseudomonadota bacterium]
MSALQKSWEYCRVVSLSFVPVGEQPIEIEDVIPEGVGDVSLTAGAQNIECKASGPDEDAGIHHVALFGSIPTITTLSILSMIDVKSSKDFTPSLADTIP